MKIKSRILQTIPQSFKTGQRVENIHTKKVYIVKRSYFQFYDATYTLGDYTVEFEPTEDQPTPWDKSTNLRAI